MSASGTGRRDRARKHADCEAVHESPDERSIPFLLNGILNALLAIDDTLREMLETSI